VAGKEGEKGNFFLKILACSIFLAKNFFYKKVQNLEQTIFIMAEFKSKIEPLGIHDIQCQKFATAGYVEIMQLPSYHQDTTLLRSSAVAVCRHCRTCQRWEEKNALTIFLKPFPPPFSFSLSCHFFLAVPSLKFR